MRAVAGGNSDYSRAGVGLSWNRTHLVSSASRILSITGLLLIAITSGQSQYPGLVKKADDKSPVLRSIAVLEWTGTPGKPSASRLIPVAVYDGEQLNDGTIYMNRPEPLAIEGGTEYELQKEGKAIGLFDVFGAGEVRGSWIGTGIWKPLTPAAAAKAAGTFNTSSLLHGIDLPEDDKPVLHRKHPKDSDSDAPKPDPKTPSADAGSGSGIGSTGATKPQVTDPDQPTLKRKSSDDSTGTDKPSTASSGTPDPDRPTLKRKAGDDSSASESQSSTKSSTGDPDRPTIRRRHDVAPEGEMETSTRAPDPDRPRLKRGKPDDLANTESPQLTGLPPTMQQQVAVSDASNRSEHPWKYTWANPDDETKMKESLEAMARTALGLDPPATPVKSTKTTAQSSTAVRRKKSMIPAEPPVPAPLSNESFRVFELTYGSTATLVLTASTPDPVAPEEAKPAPDETPVIRRGKPTQVATTPDAPKKTAAKSVDKPTPQKFVTLIAQPDLYGGLIVLSKSVTDSDHLDERPRMRLIDAVDAMGDNRGELLFELRGKSERQFALFRILRGSAEQLFATVEMP